MSAKKTKFIVVLSVIVLSLVILFNFSYTFAYYSSIKTLTTELDVGSISIDTSENTYFNAGTSYYNSISAGSNILSNDVTFNLSSTSEPAYVRAKYDASVTSKNLLSIETREIVRSGSGVWNYSNSTLRTELGNNHILLGFAINNYMSSGNIADFSYTNNQVSYSTKSNGYGIGFDFECKSGEKYTFSQETAYRSGVSYFGSDGSLLNGAGFGVVRTKSFTIPDGATHFVIVLCANTIECPVVSTKLQVERGNTETSYEEGISKVGIDIGNYLKYKNLTLTTTEDYKWSKKIGDYFYLLDDEDNPLMLEDDSDTFTFLTANANKIDNDFEYDNNALSQKFKINVSIEAIQAANITTPTLNNVVSAFNAMNEFDPGEDTYSVKFKINGTEYSAGSTTYGGSVDIPSAVQSYISNGFSLSRYGVAQVFNNGYNHSYIKDNKLYNITEDLVLYNYETITKYTVNFVSNSTTIQTSKVVSGGYAQFIGASPTKAGYSFVGWTTDGNTVVNVSSTAINANTTFIAKFVEDDDFNVYYNINGGSITTLGSTFQSSLPTNLDVYKEGYAFAGWYREADFSGTQVTTFPTLTSDLTLYAKWVSSVADVQVSNNITGFASLDDALAYAVTQTNSVVKVYSNATFSTGVTLASGKTLTIVSKNSTAKTITATATITNNGTLNLGGIDADSNTFTINSTGTLITNNTTTTINGGSYVNTSGYIVDCGTSSVTNIIDGTFTSNGNTLFNTTGGAVVNITNITIDGEIADN